MTTPAPPPPPPPADLPPLDDCGFVRVPTDDGQALWMTCDQCGKSDHFWIDGVVRCRCGARYDHAIRPDGQRIPVDRLVAVPFSEGPAQLASMEWDTTRLLMVALAVVGALGLLAWGWLR